MPNAYKLWQHIEREEGRVKNIFIEGSKYDNLAIFIGQSSIKSEYFAINFLSTDRVNKK